MYPCCASRVFKDVFIKNGLLMCTEVMAATNANSSIGQKSPQSTLGTPVTYSGITWKHSSNNLEVALKIYNVA